MTGTPGYSESEVAAIGQWLKDGLSATQIAKLLTVERRQVVTRSQIVGKVHRHDDLRAIGFKYFSGGGARRAKEGSGKPPPVAKPKLAAKPKLQASTASEDERAAYDEHDALRVPLTALGNHDCRWAVNNPQPWEGFLFCGRVAMSGSSYCRTHASRSIAPRAK